jgi:hypothetical protein
MNSKNTVGGIFCDLQKALDCVTHNIFLEQWSVMGLRAHSMHL